MAPWIVQLRQVLKCMNAVSIIIIISHIKYVTYFMYVFRKLYN